MSDLADPDALATGAVTGSTAAAPLATGPSDRPDATRS